MIFDPLYGRKFRVEIPALSSILPTVEYFYHEYHEVLVLDLPILREVELVLVWIVHTLFEYAQFPLLENQFVFPIHKYYFRKDPLCIHVSGSRILLLRAIVPLSFQSDPDLWSIPIRWESTIPVHSWILLLSESAWSSCFWISDLTSARLCSFCPSRRILICSFSRSRLDYRFWNKIGNWFVHRFLRTCSCEKGLSRWQTFFMRVICLSEVRWFFSPPEWTVVKIALFWQAHRRVPHRTSTTVQSLCRRIHSGRSLYKSLSSRSCRSRWAHNLLKRLFWPQSHTPHSVDLWHRVYWSATWPERLLWMRWSKMRKEEFKV